MKEYNGVLALDDGTFYLGKMPFEGKAAGELCFNTSMTGYQEAITDPSYIEQIITFTFPYIGNVGFNSEDTECGKKPSAKGIIIRNSITMDSSFRSEGNLIHFLKNKNIPVISNIDTRSLTHKIRAKKVSNCIISNIEKHRDIAELLKEVKSLPSMSGRELAHISTTPYIYEYFKGTNQKTIAVIDYGIKENILRILSSYGFKIVVFPFNVTFKDISSVNPNGVFLSNGPGDPTETLKYTAFTLREIAKARIPLFGICLGHQLLAGLLGGNLVKLPQGHRGINHPVINLQTGQIEITPQNHGFACSEENMPSYMKITHRSLFDDIIEGIKIVEGAVVTALGETFTAGKIFAVQYHPEACAGPRDSKYLFDEFISYL